MPLYPSLLKMILKRDWSASDICKRAALVHAAKGLSPFGMVDLSEEDVATMTQEQDDLAGASSVSIADFKANRAKLKAQTPVEAEGFLLMLKRYENLLYALFSADCPMYKQMAEIVNTLRMYSSNVRSTLTHEAKTSMLWIILLQYRRFAQGKMIGDGDAWCLGEFTNLVNLIKAKTCGNITHIEVRSELHTPSKKKWEQAKRKESDLDSDKDDTPKKKKTKKKPKKVESRIIQPYSAELKAMFHKPLEDAGNPTFGKVCEYCNITIPRLLPDLGSKDCRQFILTGTCMYGKSCKFHHRSPQLQ